MVPAPLYVHIGLQKTGTSFLQSIFWHNQDELRRQGLDMVPGSKRDTFHLMLDVRNRYQPHFDPPEVAQAVERLPRQLAAATGDRALISEESLAPATDDQIRRFLTACESREVHLVVTVRDLARQIPSAWQQLIQSGSDVTYAAYLKRLRRQEGRPRARLWTSKDVPGILTRWERYVPAERIHVVTVPQSGADPDLLLRRYCEVLGIDADRLDREVGVRNQSLGFVQAEVLRRVNGHLDAEHRRRDVYGDVGKRFFAMKVLGEQPRRRILVPPRHEEWCREVSARHVEHLKAGGYDVVGDLSELLPAAGSFGTMRGGPRDDEVAEVAIAALASLLTAQMDRIRQRRLASDGPSATGAAARLRARAGAALRGLRR